MIVNRTASITHPTFDPTHLNLKVLLVEKHWPDQRLVSKMLEARGCKVISACNLQEAGNFIKTMDVDMVLMDINIFRNNGFDIMAAIEASESKRNQPIPMIAMAENYVKEQRDYFMGIGMDDYIPKPVFEGELCRIIERLVADTSFISAVSNTSYDRKIEETTA